MKSSEKKSKPGPRAFIYRALFYYWANTENMLVLGGPLSEAGKKQPFLKMWLVYEPMEQSFRHSK